VSASLRDSLMAAPLAWDTLATLLFILAEMDDLKAELGILRAEQRRLCYRWN